MSKFWLLFLLLLCACAPRGPELSVQDSVWNVGAVITGSFHEKQVQLVNNGDAPLVIEKVEDCCGFYGQLTGPITIPPAGRVSLTLQLNPFKMVGDLNAELYVVSNDPKQPRFPLAAVGQVVPKIYALAELEGHWIDLGLLEPGIAAPFALEVSNPGNAVLSVHRMEKSSAIHEAGTLQAIPAGSTGVWAFTYVTATTGPIEEALTISTNDALNRTLSVQLRGYVVPRQESRHGLLISPVGKKATYDVAEKVYRYDFVLRNQGEHRVGIAAGPVTLPGLRLDLPTILEPGEERAASAVLPLSPAGGTMELRITLPFIIQ